MTQTLPNLSLSPAGADREQNAYSFPSGKQTLICFVKEDCPTTRTSMPLLQQAKEIFGENIDVVALAQNGEDDLVLVQEYGLTVPFLDDSRLNTSYSRLSLFFISYFKLIPLSSIIQRLN